MSGSLAAVLTRRRAGLTSLSAVGVARVVSVVGGAIQVPMLTRHLDPRSYALAAAAITLGSYVGLVAASSTVNGFRRFPGSRHAPGNYAYARTRVLLSLAVTAAAAVGLASLFGVVDYALPAMAWGAALASMQLVATAWMMWSEAWSYAATVIVSTVVRLAVMVVLVVLGAGVVVALTAAGAASLVAVWALSPRAVGRAGRVRPWPRWIGAGLATAAALALVLSSADRVLFVHLADPAQTGTYAAMSTVAFLTFGSVFTTMSTATFPDVLTRWNSGSRDAVVRAIRGVGHVYVVVTALGCAVVSLGGDRLMRVVLGSGYIDRGLFVTLSCAACLLGVAGRAAWMLQLRMRTATLVAVAAVPAAIEVALLVWLIPLGGARASALVMLGSALAYLVATVVHGGLGRSAALPSAWLTAAGVLSILDRPVLATYALVAAIGCAAGAYAFDRAGPAPHPSTVESLAEAS